MRTAGLSIVDVSRRAGVSTATVSRVINNHPRVSPQAIGAVRKAMAELDYRPPAPELRRRYRPRPGSRSSRPTIGSVALLFPDSRDIALRTALSGRFMHGANEVLLGKGMHMVVTPLLPNGRLPSCIQDRKVDGVIVRGATDVAAVDAMLAGLGLPVVWLMHTQPATPTVGDLVTENVSRVGELAAEFLVSKGYRRLITVNHAPAHPCYAPRSRAFVEAVREMRASGQYDIDGPAQWVQADRPLDQLVRRVLAGIPKEHMHETGLFFPHPDAELSVSYKAMTDAGVRPGKDFGFIACSYDPTRLATMDPMLSNIDVHAEAIASAAAELLLWRSANANEPRRRMMIQPALQHPLEVGATPVGAGLGVP